MRQTEALKLAREKTYQDSIATFKEVTLHVIDSPLMKLALFVAFVELMQMIRPDGKHQIISDLTGSSMESVAITAESVKLLSDSLSAAIPTVKELAGAFIK